MTNFSNQINREEKGGISGQNPQPANAALRPRNGNSPDSENNQTASKEKRAEGGARGNSAHVGRNTSSKH